MELIERAGFLTLLEKQFEHVTAGEGHCAFISGEAGIGKTSIVKALCKQRRNDCAIYQGTCDALFTPRPLAPLYDIARQLGIDLWINSGELSDRAEFFTRVFRELENQKKIPLVIFEDIHWADEASLDFIKFLARRITHLRCWFILTYRDDEIHAHHPLRNVLGQLPADSFTRLQLTPLSRQAVEKLAREKGYNGEDVYGISGGNPFYVNEILASYSPGVPDNIKDSILSVYNRQDEDTKNMWKLLSVLPTGLETKYLEKIEPSFTTALENSLASKILILKEEQISFKHELYRRTIEESLSPLVSLALNRKILGLLREISEQNQEIERIIHHAKNAHENDLVVYYAPIAARQAAGLGAHIQASELYSTAIKYYQGKDKDLLIQFYEDYSYECYLTNQIKEAITYQEKSLALWEEKGNVEKIGNSMRFLSRLWWFYGNRKQADSFGRQAIEVLEDQPSSSAKAMAFSNMSQLKMLAEQPEDCIFWGEKAIAIAEELGDEAILSHALNNVGTAQMGIPSRKQKSIGLLQQSLAIALKNAYHEHAARAFTNLSSNSVKIKEYAFAREILKAGILYCEERDLDSWKAYMLSWQARLDLETGRWDEAYTIADTLIKNERQTSIIKIGALAIVAVIRMRRGDADVLSLLLEAKNKAFEAMELQRIIPALVALLEYEWITGKAFIEKEAIDLTIGMIEQMGSYFENNEFAFWLLKIRKQQAPLREIYDGYQIYNPPVALKAASLWEELGCPYQQALCLFESGGAGKRKAITIVRALGANAVYEKMKQELRSSGIISIPRGIRKTTRSNPALLTNRELDVLQLLKEGMQNKEIAVRLYISVKTVDHHISAILFKLDVNSRAKAVRQAVSKGVIK